MKTDSFQNLPISGENDGKNTKKITDRLFFYEFLLDKSTSCTSVAESTGIRQKSCTQYKRFWEKLGKLQVIDKSKCPYTGRLVQFITTNEKLFTKPIGIQTSLFDQ